MKYFNFISLICIITLFSCQDNVLQQEPISRNEVRELKEGMPRVVVSSRAELKSIIDQMGDGESLLSRAVGPGNMPTTPPVLMSENEELFVSLVEANRQKVMSSLTPEQLDSIQNDEDGLEFCPEDSIIADIRFAMLLNRDREIQVGDTIFRYFANGVAFTLACHQSELDSLKNLIPHIDIQPDDGAHTTTIPGSHVDFMPIYFSNERDTEIVEGGGGSQILTAEDYEDIKNIPACHMRDIRYKPGEAKDATDGNWFHRTFTGFFGENVTAIKEFRTGRKLVLSFYDQNYYIYAAIGTSLKMQKRKCGIWWNIKAEKMIHGWETVTIRHTKPKPIPPTTFSYPTWDNPTITLPSSHPFSMAKKTLFYIPYTNYQVTAQDVTNAYKAAANYAYDKASTWAKSRLNGVNDIGMMCLNDENNKELFFIYGPDEMATLNEKSLSHKFYAKYFSGEFEMTFSLSNVFKLIKVTFDQDDGVDLYSGRVYGAIKYEGQWRAARITKYRE